MRMSRFAAGPPGWGALILVLAAGAAAWGQVAGTAEDPLGAPTERGIRLTPEMARAMAKQFVQGMGGHYELDAAKHGDATEMVARRLMAAAHAMDGKSSELIEFALARVFDRNSGGRGFWEPEFQAEFAQRMMPMIPAVKDLVRGVGQDLRPMLSMKQQLKLGAEFTVAGAALDTFQQNMERWARGEGGPQDNPFIASVESEIRERTPNGESVALKRAREAAEKAVQREELLKRMWSTYLEEAKKYYQFDASQCATGDSMLREYLDRARLMLNSPEWRERYYRVQLWQQLIWRAKMTRHRFFNEILNRENTAALAAMDALGDEFRLKVDTIPTVPQQDAAEERIVVALSKYGYKASQEAP